MKDDKPIAFIEYQGNQHYNDGKNHWYTSYEIVHQRDLNKQKYCKEVLNIPLYEIPYWEFDNLEKILQNII